MQFREQVSPPSGADGFTTIARRAALQRPPDSNLTAEQRAETLATLRLTPMYRRREATIGAELICIGIILAFYSWRYGPPPVEAYAWAVALLASLAGEVWTRRTWHTPRGQQMLLERPRWATYRWRLANAVNAVIWGWGFVWVVSGMAPADDAAFVILATSLAGVKVTAQYRTPEGVYAKLLVSLVLPAIGAYAYHAHLRDTLAMGTIAAAGLLAMAGNKLSRARDKQMLAIWERQQALERLERENRQLREQVQQAQATLSSVQSSERGRRDFIDHLSHDLTQPLMAIALSAKQAAACLDHADVPAARRAVDDVLTTQGATARMLQDFLLVSRLEAGRHRYTKVWFEVRDLLRELDTTFRAAALEKNGLDLRLRASRRLGPLFVDRNALRQVLVNLISNAIKYTEDGEVLVTVRRRGNSAEVRVWDTGPGFTEEQRHRIFEAFWRGDEAGPLKADGSGIGLTIAQRMAQGIGSDLKLLQLPRRGAVFELVLPLPPKTA